MSLLSVDFSTLATDCSCTSTAVASSITTFIITALLSATITVVVHALLYYRKKPRVNTGQREGEDEAVYEIVDDNATTNLEMKPNDAYVTTQES